jgi:hypothetical protein
LQALVRLSQKLVQAVPLQHLRDIAGIDAHAPAAETNTHQVH